MSVSVKAIKIMSGLDLMQKRVNTYSYDSTDSRLVGGKYKSFQAALKLLYFPLTFRPSALSYPK
jgi:hypothetical protein